jgi:hypothetical protein
MLAPYIGEANRWMLAHHQLFQDYHVMHLSSAQRHARERWRGHPHFGWAVRFAAEFDQTSLSADTPTRTLESFAPLVHRLYARAPHPAAPLSD